MKPGECGSSHVACWAALEDCGDCFEQVLAAVHPADVAACRLVSRSWRQHVDLLLQQLQPATDMQPASIVAIWQHLVRLQLAASARSGLPPLDALQRLRCLRSLALHGAPGGTGELDCRSLAPLVSLPGLESLEARGFLLRHASALQNLTQLARLELRSCNLGEWLGTLPALLLPLTRLSHLGFHAVRKAGDTSVPLLSGLSRLTSLASLELSSEDAASDAACQEIATLPGLAGLAIARCTSYGNSVPSITDHGVEVLAGRLSRQLTTLTLGGHSLLTDRGLLAVASMQGLQHLELRFGDSALPGAVHPLVSDEGLAALGALTRLQSLHLGGACTLGERACASLAARLHSLTCLQLSDVRSLEDRGLFKLAPLAPRLRRLGLINCEGVTDISMVLVLRSAPKLSHLELAGCHRNITGIGLQVGILRRLRHLNLAGCGAITDVEIEALLPAARSLEHLNLSDCRVSDRTCELLATCAPNLQWLSLEHCPRVSRQGLLCLATGLPLLRELHLVGTGVPAEAAAQLRATPRGRRLRIATLKHCWWVSSAAPDQVSGQVAIAVH